jgi:hypothetical protein
MAARWFTTSYGVVSPSVAGTGLVTDGATDPGTGDFIVAIRDVTVGTKKDLCDALDRIKVYLLSETPTSPAS